MKAAPIGLWIILAAIAVYVVCRLLSGFWQPSRRFYNRPKDIRLRQHISDSLEESLPIHLDIGSSYEGDLAGGSALAAISTAETVSSQMAFADEPWIISCGTSCLTCFERDAVKNGLRTADYGSDPDSENAHFNGFSNLSHQNTTLCDLNGDSVTLHLNIGSFGSAVLVQDMILPIKEGICIAGDDLLSQSVGFLCSDTLYIGEQVFEIPEILAKKSHRVPSLVAMDVIRLVLIVGTAVKCVLCLLN